MPCWLAVVPRRMLPPPTTSPSCTPSPATALSSSVNRSMTPKSMPDPPLFPPANASPDTLRRARE